MSDNTEDEKDNWTSEKVEIVETANKDLGKYLDTSTGVNHYKRLKIIICSLLCAHGMTFNLSTFRRKGNDIRASSRKI